MSDAPSPSYPEVSGLRHGIYTASKTKHAHLWLALRKSGEPIISTWIDEAGEGESVDLHDLWNRCITESRSCKVLIVYKEPEDVLKGAWVEIGAALAAGVPVYAVGLDGFTISKYRGIKHFPSIAAAFSAARSILGVAQSVPEPSKTTIPFVFNYENYRGEVSMRVVTPISVRFGSTDWHPSPQWLLLAFDHERRAEREFAMADMGTTVVPSTDSQPFYGAECPSYPHCSGGCGLGCTKEIETAKVSSLSSTDHQ